MNKKLSVVIFTLLFSCVLVYLGVSYIEKVTPSNNKNQLSMVNNDFQIITDKGNKLLDITTTWGDYLSLYMKGNPQVTYYNPRQDIDKTNKVRVIKIEYPNGLESMVGYVKYALVYRVYNIDTGELLTSAGDYLNKN